MRASFQGKIAVVTGGASGIGEACCAVLKERGARVVVTDVDAGKAKAVAAALGAEMRLLDVGDETAIERAAAEIESAIGPVDILVNSAGVLQRPEAAADLSVADWDRVVRIDQRGVYFCCLAFGERMAQRGTGSIINIASVAGMRSMPLHAYAPAKAAVISMTECLAAEWGRCGVRVNAVSPGFTLTPAIKAAIAAGQRDSSLLEQNAAMGRMVQPSEIADGVAFLASSEASAITGVTLPIDCGWLVAPSWSTYGGLRPGRN
ncbi:MAG TPA: SDR family oxidoreductase [Terriglobia bacterium]|nr:SDR family oxidoreductase [Terriglobia bacterium]